MDRAFNNYNDNYDTVSDSTPPITSTRFNNHVGDSFTNNNDLNENIYGASATPFTDDLDDQAYSTHASLRPSRRTSSFMPQTNCPGGTNVNQPSRVPNVRACQSDCINDNDCKAWSFNGLTQQCFLKRQVVPCSPNQVYTSGIISGGVEPVPPIGYGTRLSTTLNDVSFADRPSRVIRAPNTNSCRNSCLDNRQCNQWSYDPSYNKCSLNYGTSQIVSPNLGATSGEIYIRRGAPVPHPRPIQPLPQPVWPQPQPIRPIPAPLPQPVWPQPQPIRPIPAPLPQPTTPIGSTYDLPGYSILA